MLRAVIVALLLAPACKADKLACPLANKWKAGGETLVLDEDDTGEWTEKTAVVFRWRPIAKGLDFTIDGEERVIGFRVEETEDTCILELERPPVEQSDQRRFEAFRPH